MRSRDRDLDEAHQAWLRELVAALLAAREQGEDAVRVLDGAAELVAVLQSGRVFVLCTRARRDTPLADLSFMSLAIDVAVDRRPGDVNLPRLGQFRDLAGLNLFRGVEVADLLELREVSRSTFKLAAAMITG